VLATAALYLRKVCSRSHARCVPAAASQAGPGRPALGLATSDISSLVGRLHRSFPLLLALTRAPVSLRPAPHSCQAEPTYFDSADWALSKVRAATRLLVGVLRTRPFISRTPLPTAERHDAETGASVWPAESDGSAAGSTSTSTSTSTGQQLSRAEYRPCGACPSRRRRQHTDVRLVALLSIHVEQTHVTHASLCTREVLGTHTSRTCRVGTLCIVIQSGFWVCVKSLLAQHQRVEVQEAQGSHWRSRYRRSGRRVCLG
jgi:hypothetical protein